MAYQALKNAGIKVDKYFSFEIDKYAIEVAMKNHPDIIQLGDIKKINFKNLPKIDLLIGGSPCQGFSFSGKMLNFNDPRSALFFNFIEAKNIIKPKYYLLENVKMKKEYEERITELMGVNPMFINSSKLSAQQRRRLY